MNTRYLWLSASLLVFVAACVGLSPEQQQTAIQGIEQLVAAGTISREQADAMIAALSGGDGWSKVLEIAAQVGGTVVLTLLTILGWRGPVNARKGSPPVKVPA